MKKRKRKFIIVFMLLFACLLLVGTTYASAEDEEIETSGACGENATWNYDVASGVLTISGTGEMEDYKKSYAVPWYEHSLHIKEIVIEPGITKIGSLAFNSCVATSVSIPESVTHINSASFEQCVNLVEIKLPSKLEFIGNNAFYYCRRLKDISLPESVTSFGSGLFSDCLSLEQITIPSNLKHIPRRMFAGSGLRWITIPATVESVGAEVFSSCHNLEAVQFRGDAPEFDKSAFSGANIKATYPVSNSTWSAAKCQNYGGTVKWETDSGNGQYGTYRMLNWKMEGNTLYITRDPQVEGGKLSAVIGWHAHRDTIEKVVMSGEIDMITARFFEGCKKLKQVQWPDGVTLISEDAFKDCTALEMIIIPDTVTTIRWDAFSGCSGLKSVELPKNLEYIESYAFRNCSGLQSLAIPSGVKRMSSCVFEGCTSLKTIKFTGPKPELVDYKYTPGIEIKPGVFQLPSTEPGTFGLIGSVVTVYYPENAEKWTEQNVQKLAEQYAKDAVTFTSYKPESEKPQEPVKTPDEAIGNGGDEQPGATEQTTPQTGPQINDPEELPTGGQHPSDNGNAATGAGTQQNQQNTLEDTPTRNKTGAKWWIVAVVIVIVAAGATGAFLFIQKKKS